MIRPLVRSTGLCNLRLRPACLGSSRLPGSAVPSRLPTGVATTSPGLVVRRHSIRYLTSSPPKSSSSTKTESTSSKLSQMWQRFLAPKEMPKRYTAAWYREIALICTVFAVTGSSTMVLVRPAVSKGLGIQGSLKDGPWSYRISSLVVMSPIYSVLLVVVGTAFGRHAYFRHFSAKLLRRFGVPPEMVDKTFHETRKNFRKW